MTHDNLLGIPPTLLDDEPELSVVAALGRGEDVTRLAATYPAASLPWAVLAERALAGDRTVEA
jgi:hypothetical protein